MWLVVLVTRFDLTQIRFEKYGTWGTFMCLVEICLREFQHVHWMKGSLRGGTAAVVLNQPSIQAAYCKVNSTDQSTNDWLWASGQVT